MKMAFFDTKPYDERGFREAGERYGIEYRFFETKLTAHTCSLAAGCDGVVVFVSDTVDREVIDRLCGMGIRLVALRCAGFNNVDLKAAEGRVTVVRVPSYSPSAVAEHAFALLLCLCRRIHRAYLRTREFNFSLNGLTGKGLKGKVAGIVGAGQIGRAFAEIAAGFGMEVLAYDPFPAADSGLAYRSLDEVLKRSDVLSLHCPLTAETRHMIDGQAITAMRDGAVLINTSRGALVDSEALLHGLRSGKLGGACLDVYEEETELFYEDLSDRTVRDELLATLISLPNVIVTSHQAFLTEEALTAIAEITSRNVVTVLKREPCENEVREKRA
ncbi:MAG: 2-hydroxyacid dehydrogenase [Ruminococcaceae bacterium]|nr:2-hydroxyacid dehydrogenase [Oscillospiraceae bacterium]